MVIRILLLLLSALFLSQCAEYHIDLDQCGKNTDCFVRESCIDQKTRKDVLVKRTTQKWKTGDCDVILQTRQYAELKFLIMMQVNISDSTTETIADSGVSLKQDVVQFACTKSGPTGNTALFKIEKQEDHVYNDKIVFCAFTLETIDNTPIYLKFLDNNENPALEFTLGTPQTITFARNKEKLWKDIEDRCNPEMLTSTFKSDGVFLRDKIDTLAYPPFNCDPQKSLIITRENKPLSMLEQGEPLECQTTNWEYNENAARITIPEKETLNVVCGSRFCSLCAPLDFLAGPGRSDPKETTVEGDCKTYSCSEKQNIWMLADGSVVEGDSIECKQEFATPFSRNAFWYLATSAEPVKVEKAACFDKTICWAKRNLVLCPENPIRECHLYNRSSDFTELLCPPGLTLMWEYTGKSGQPSKITCDFVTGTYKDVDNNEQMTFPHSVYCAGKLIPKPEEAAASQGNMGAIAGGVGGALVVLAGIGVAAFLLVRRRRAAMPGDAPKTQGTDKSAQIAPPPFVPPTADEEAANKKAPDTARGPWLQRNRKREEVIPTFTLGYPYTAGDFLLRILPEITQYSTENRVHALYQVTAFNAYGEPPPGAENSLKEYGNMNQFWLVFKACEDKNLDCAVTWEMLIRMVKIMYGMMEDANFIRTNCMDLRIKNRLIKFGKPILAELGWKIQPGEDVTDTNMRFFVVRVLLWAGDAETMAELKRQSELPIEQLEGPIRAVVFLYAARHLMQATALRKKHWKTVFMQDPQDPAKDKFGTMRQHLLFGLCGAYSPTKKRKLHVMHDILNQLTDFKVCKLKQVITPIDTLWAYRGATEYYTNMKEAVYSFADSVPSCLIANRQMHLANLLPENADETVVTPVRNAWIKATLDTLYMLAECCTYDKMYRTYATDAMPYMEYCELDDKELKYDKLLFDRANNLEWRFCQDAEKLDKRRHEKYAMAFKVADEFLYSFTHYEKSIPTFQLDKPEL